MSASSSFEMSVPWRDREGMPLSCAEKLRVLRENDAELRQVLQDAFEDGILMGVSAQSMLDTFNEMLSGLKDPTSGDKA